VAVGTSQFSQQDLAFFLDDITIKRSYPIFWKRFAHRLEIFSLPLPKGTLSVGLKFAGQENTFSPAAKQVVLATRHTGTFYPLQDVKKCMDEQGFYINGKRGSQLGLEIML
jgi:hypothetical protein